MPLLLELLIGGDALRVRGRASTPNEHMCMSLLMMSSLPPPPASQSSKVERELIISINSLPHPCNGYVTVTMASVMIV